MRYNESSIQEHRRRIFWIVAVVISSTAIASGLGLKRFFATGVRGATTAKTATVRQGWSSCSKRDNVA